MASIKKKVDKSGRPTYIVQASAGRGRRVKRTWRPQDGWSQRTIERELQKFAAQLENELSNGVVKTHKEDMEEKRRLEQEAAKLRTLRQYAQDVFMLGKQGILSNNTLSSYQMFLDKHILPTLGNFLMTDITPAMLNSLLLNYQKRGYAHSSCKKLHALLGVLFKAAFMDDSIPSNPMLKVTCPKPRKDELSKNEAEEAYTPEEARYILECLQHEPLKWRAYVTLLIDTGARRGEALGIKWEDIDWENHAVRICRNMQYAPEYGVYETTPKNGKERTVPVWDETLALLHSLLIEQSRKALSPFVFSQDGSAEVLHPQTPTKYFHDFGKRYHIENFHPHKLRHTSATLAILSGADIASVSARLGHSDISTTLRIYTHASEEGMRRAGELARDAIKAGNE